MAVVDGSWSECSDDDSWYDVVNDDDEVVEVIGYDDHKDFLNGDQGIVDSFVKLPRPDYQVIRADQKEIKAMLKQLETKEKKRGASESDSSNDIISCINESYCDYCDGSWCEISVNDNESVDSFVRVNMTTKLFSTSNVIEKVDHEVRVTDDLVTKSDVEVVIVDTLKKDDELDKKVKSKEQGNDKPKSVKEDNEAGHSMFSPFIRDKYTADEIIPYVLFSGKTQREARDAKVPFPTFEDEQLGELIKNAHVQLDKKRRTRDLFRAQIALQEWRVSRHNDALNAASKKVMVARELVELKENEIDYVKNVIKRFKNIDVVEDIDIKIRKLEKRIQYESMSMRDEKKLIREINQLRRIRDMGSRYEIQEALDRKEHMDELVEDLKDELEVLQDDVSKAEKTAQAIKKTYEKEAEIEEEMWAQYKVIQDSREETLVYLEGLKKRLDEKKIDFLMHDEGLRAHGEEEMKKEEIDAILKDLRDLEEEVCNDAFMGATRYFYSPPGHQLISQFNPFFQPMINKPMERQKHDVQKAQMQAEQREQKEAEQREEVRLAMERQKHDVDKARMRVEQLAQKEAEQKAKANLKQLKRKERKRAKSCSNGTTRNIIMILWAALYFGIKLMIFLTILPGKNSWF